MNLRTNRRLYPPGNSLWEPGEGGGLFEEIREPAESLDASPEGDPESTLSVVESETVPDRNCLILCQRQGVF